MKVLDQIEQAGMSPAVAAAFRRAVDEVLSSGGGSAVEEALLDGVFARLGVGAAVAADFDELWPHAELLVRVAVWLALADGHYGVEEARVISSLAHRLGLSAVALASLEAEVFDQARARARLLQGERPTSDR